MNNRELALLPRKVDTREKNNIEIVQFELDEIKNHFDESINEIKNQLILADDLLNENKKSHAEYIWRGQIVFLESAFDFYMHELSKYGLHQIYNGMWSETQKYRNMQVDMKYVSRAIKEGRTSEWFFEFINSYFENDTLVSHESFKRQMNLLGIEVKDIANSAFYEVDSKEKTSDKLKRRLNQLFLRRNMIAHQFDRLHEDAQIQNVSKEIVVEFISDIELITEAIYKEMKER